MNGCSKRKCVELKDYVVKHLGDAVRRPQFEVGGRIKVKERNR